MKLTFLTILITTFLTISCGAEQSKSNNTNADDIALFEKNDKTKSERKKEKRIKLDDEIYGSRQNAITKAVGKAAPAVVGINVTETKKVVYRDPFGDDLFGLFFRRYGGGRKVREYEVKGLGSGFIISPDGYILTNHHVAGNASKIIVTTTDGEEYEAEIIGSDFTSDVALLKIEGQDLPYLDFCESDDLMIGEWAIALGNPFGLFENNAKPTVTVGVVSNSGVSFVQNDQDGVRVYPEMIQTDAAISSGNSGGPLVNALGEVIGMNTIIFSTAVDRQGSGSIGIGFSIPAKRVLEIVDEIKSNGKVERDYYTGIEIRALNRRISRQLGLDTDDGIIIFGINKNSPADLAGLDPGDLIVEIEGRKILDEEDYLLSVMDRRTGDKIEFVILRGEERLVKELILVKPPRRR